MLADNDIKTDERFILAVRQQEASDFITAGQLYGELLGIYPDNFELLQRTGYVLAQLGRIEESIRHLKHAVSLQPVNAMAYYGLAMALDRNGDQDAALDSLQQALACEPNYYHAQIAISEIKLPFENYMHVLKRFHHWLRPSNYVEIGVESGASIALAEPPTLCIGIDPDPQIQLQLSAPTRIFSVTSDEFFASHDLCAELGNRTVDLAFIDGLHHFEAALKDLMNIERYSSKDTVVLIHDCIPLDEVTSTRDRKTNFWSGDTWKIIPVLKKYRPDLGIITIPAPPTGLTVVTDLDSGSMVLAENLDAIVEEYLSLDYSYLEQDKDEILNVVYDDWQSIQDAIR